MTTAVYRNTPALSVPASQDTAPVLEFNCLYTHDVRKKAKKWQDGFLRYHTFNKRVMVYDIPRNYVGDAHWTGGGVLREGDELTLERCGVLVEVGDSTGQTETDLTELRQSRKKIPSAADVRTLNKSAPGPTAKSSTSSATSSRLGTQSKHCSLNAILGAPKGPLGKATLPQKSPFDTRHTLEETENQEWENGRPPKRARVDSAPAWNVTRITKSPKPAKQVEAPLRARIVDTAKQKKKPALQPGQPRLGTKELITSSGDEEYSHETDFLPGFSSDALAAASPPAKGRVGGAQKSLPRSSSPAFQTQQAISPVGKEGTVAELKKTSRETVKARPNSTEGPRRPVEYLEPVQTPQGPSAVSSPVAAEPSTCVSQQAELPSRKPSQTYRLAATGPKKKKTLLCQAQFENKFKKVSSIRADEADSPLDGVVEIDCAKGQRASRDRNLAEARLAAIDRKKSKTSTAGPNPSKRNPAPETNIDNAPIDEASADTEPPTGESRPQTSHKASAMELGRLDQLMLPPARTHAPERQLSPPSRPQPLAPPPREERPLRRAVSDTAPIPKKPNHSNRPPGAPVRYTPTPSPTKKSHEPTPAAAQPPSKKTAKPRKALQKSVSLNMTAGGTSAVILSKPFQAPGRPGKSGRREPELPEDVGPWSREAFDLFTWRPADWDEEKWSQKEDPVVVG